MCPKDTYLVPTCVELATTDLISANSEEINILFLVPHRPWRRRKHFEATVLILLVKQLPENKACETVGHCRWGKGRDGGHV